MENIYPFSLHIPLSVLGRELHVLIMWWKKQLRKSAGSKLMHSDDWHSLYKVGQLILANELTEAVVCSFEWTDFKNDLFEIITIGCF